MLCEMMTSLFFERLISMISLTRVYRLWLLLGGVHLKNVLWVHHR